MESQAASETRPYRMVARAEAVAGTRTRIVDAAIASLWDSPTLDVPLDDVAARAEVSTRTVLRHFASKQGLLEAAIARESERVTRERETAPPGDVTGAVRVLVDHHEQMGDRVVVLLAEEQRNPELRRLADIGRDGHRGWCERVFADALAATSGADRERRLAQLMAVCDVYTWKLLRRDADLSRRQTERALVEMLEPLTEVPS
jgi:AcrR family transcriptional regulator